MERLIRIAFRFVIHLTIGGLLFYGLGEANGSPSFHFSTYVWYQWLAICFLVCLLLGFAISPELNKEN